MQHGAQRPSAAASELPFGFVQGFGLIRQRLFGGWQAAHGAHIPTHRLSQRLRPGQALLLPDPIELGEFLSGNTVAIFFRPACCRNLISDLLHRFYHSGIERSLIRSPRRRGNE